MAVLTDPPFEAARIDPATARFGAAGARPVRVSLEDFDGDGDLDLVLHFRTDETGIQCGDESAALAFEMSNCPPLSDSIVTVGCGDEE